MASSILTTRFPLPSIIDASQLPLATPSSPGAAPKWIFPAVPTYYDALGDSITSVSPADGGGFGNSFAIQLAPLLGCTLRMQAVGGAVVKPFTAHAQASTQVDAVLAESPAPDLLTWCFGPNDYGLGNTLGDFNTVMVKPFASLDQTLSFAEAVRYNLERLVTGLPNTRIVVVEMFQNQQYDGADCQFCEMQNAIARAMGIQVAPARKESGLWAWNSALWVDLIHPNQLGGSIAAKWLQHFLVG